MTPLSAKEKAALRSAAQTIKPAVHVGKEGLQPGVAAELEAAFRGAELVKVAFRAGREELAPLCAEVERLTGSECVGGVGRRRSFFRHRGDSQREA